MNSYGSIVIKYRAKLTWTDDNGFHEDVLCNVVHEIDQEPDGTYKTMGFDWSAYTDD